MIEIAKEWEKGTQECTAYTFFAILYIVKLTETSKNQNHLSCVGKTSMNYVQCTETNIQETQYSNESFVYY